MGGKIAVFICLILLDRVGCRSRLNSIQGFQIFEDSNNFIRREHYERFCFYCNLGDTFGHCVMF